MVCGGGLTGGRHSQVDGGSAAGGDVVHLGELVFGGGQVCFAAFGLAELPAVLGFFDSHCEVQDDLGKVDFLGGIRAKEGASQASVFVRAWGSVGAAAVAEGDFPAGEVTAEVVPFGVGDGRVFVGWAQGAAAGDEFPVGVDGLLGIDGVVVHRDVDVLVAGEQLADVRRHAVGDRLGDEDPPEVVGLHGERLPGDVGDPGRGQGFRQEQPDRAVRDRPVLHAEAALEQQRHGGVVELPLVAVVTAHAGNSAGGIADPGDDRAEHAGEHRAYDDQALLVGLGRDDVQQRDYLAGAVVPVPDQAVVGDLAELFNPDACLVKGFGACPGPERVVLGRGEVGAHAAGRGFGPHVDRLPSGGGDRPAQRDDTATPTPNSRTAVWTSAGLAIVNRSYGRVKKKSNHAAADAAAIPPATRFPVAATATTTATSRRATFVFGQCARNGRRTAAAASGATKAAAIAARSLDT